ncbi:MAG: ABC transporter ATP-binding protein [Ignavibacteria bacterium]|nr:ABC transporter ATP-binding protein [Ignavibacteria bacterium]
MSTERKTVIRSRQITKEYKISKTETLRVLKGIDVDITEGEIVSIVGPSGAGKSTLLHILGTLDSPSSGTVEIDSVNISELSSSQLAKLRNEKIGFVFQFHHLLPEFTALENAAIASMIGGRSPKESEERARELLGEVGLSERLNHKPSELSGGEAQRVAIARALMNNPNVVLADEPTGNLDSRNSEEVMNLIFRLREKFNQTFVIVTHNENFARMTDRTLNMKDGLIIS